MSHGEEFNGIELKFFLKKRGQVPSCARRRRRRRSGLRAKGRGIVIIIKTKTNIT